MSLGAGSTVTFNTIVMAVAYFRESLGEGVLAKLSLAHNVALLATMGGLIVLMPRNPSLCVYRLATRGAFAYAFLLNALVLHAAAVRRPLSSSLFLALVGLNGVATGLAQGLGASLGGLFDPYSLATGCGGWQLSGAAFGVLVPTLTQLALLLVESSAPHSAKGLKDEARIGALVSCAIGALVALVAWFSVGVLASTRVWREVDSQSGAAVDPHPGTGRAGEELQTRPRVPRPPAGSVACKNPEVDSIGKCIAVGSNGVLLLRLRQLATVMGAQFLNEFAFVALVLTAPALPVTGTSFVREFLATLLLIVANIGSFAGRIAATGVGLGDPPAAKLLGRHCRAFVLTVLVLLVPACALVTHGYGRTVCAGRIQRVGAQWLALLFVLATSISGFAMVSLGQLSQRLCNHSFRTPCELTAQFIWLSVNAGALGGTITSLVLANRRGGMFGTELS
jgi:hypothetical protein